MGNLPQSIEAYLQHVRVERMLSARTCELYLQDLIKLCDHAQKSRADVLAVTSVHVRAWVMQMHSGGRSARGIALIMSGWRGFYKWAGSQGLVSIQPLDGVRAPKAPKPLPKALGVDDAVRLANHKTTTADPATAWLDARDALVVELLYGSGLRIAELAALDHPPTPHSTAWIDVDAAMATVTGKGKKQRSTPVGRHALAALAQWESVRPNGLNRGATAGPALLINAAGERLSVQSIRVRLRSRSLAAGLATPVHPHMLRHSFASHILQSSGDLQAVQELLGHANISTTQVYTRLDFQHLAAVYDKAHPRAKLKP